jgi:ketopantoate reductase
VEADRKTEVEMFAGRVIEMGRRYDVPTPVNQRLFDQIRKIESDAATNHLREGDELAKSSFPLP